MKIEFLLFLVLLVLGYFGIVSDFKTRKINNYITLSFLVVSFVLFCLNLSNLTLNSLFLLFMTSFIVYYLYKKDYMGAADGKLLISFCLLILGFYNDDKYLDYLVNLFVVYSISIILIVFYGVSKQTKRRVFRELNFLTLFFQVSIILVVIYNVFNYFNMGFNDLKANTSIIFIKLIIIGLLLKYLTPKFSELDIQFKLLLNVILIYLLYVMVGFNFIMLFLAFYLFRILIEWISVLSTKLRFEFKKFYSPFSVYIFMAYYFLYLFSFNLLEYFIFLFK